MGGNIIWQCFCILSQMFCLRNFSFTRKEQKTFLIEGTQRFSVCVFTVQIALWSLFDENTKCKCPPSWFWVETDDNAIQEVVWYKRFDFSSAKCCCTALASSKMWTWLNLLIVGLLKIWLVSVYRCVAKCKCDVRTPSDSNPVHQDS